MIDYERLACEVVRALRGDRSQVAFSRRLKSRGNVVASWEGGRRFPTASRSFFIAERAGIDVRAALARFYQAPPPWLATTDLCSARGVAALLDDLRGGTAIADVAERAGRSRYAVSRWLRGLAEPRLPDFLRMVDATSLRLADFLATWLDPSDLPSIASAWQELVAAREAAYDVPWSHAVLRVLELEAYQSQVCHQPGYVARLLGISEEEEARCIDVLHRSRQIEWRSERWFPTRILTLDTRQDSSQGSQLKSFWARVVVERMQRGDPGLFSYNLFTVSDADLKLIEDLHRAYFRQLRSIVAASAPGEQVVLANLQLLRFAGSPG